MHHDRSVTVLTPAVPQRFHLLANCIESVRNQTVKPHAHLIGVDYEKIGCGAMINKLSEGVRTQWLAFLADDDVFYPNHLEVLINAATPKTVVSYSWCNVVGWDRKINRYFDAKELRRENYIPGTVLMRTSVFNAIGKFSNDAFVQEDWIMWKKVLAIYREEAFTLTPEITWEYRFHGKNITFGWRGEE